MLINSTVEFSNVLQEHAYKGIAKTAVSDAEKK